MVKKCLTPRALDKCVHSPSLSGIQPLRRILLERAIAGEGLMLAYGDMKDTDNGKAKIAELIIKALADYGFAYEWDGNIRKRIKIPNIIWPRRSK